MSDTASRATRPTQESPAPGCAYTPLLLIQTPILSMSNPSLPLTAWHSHNYRMNQKDIPLPRPRRKRGRRRRSRERKSPKRRSRRRTKEGRFAFGADQTSTSPLTAHRRIATAGDALPPTIGPKTAFGQVLARRTGGAASVSRWAATTRSTVPSMRCVGLVVRGAPLVSSRHTTAKTPHRRRKAMTPMLTSMTSSTLKHSRESGRWEGLMS